MIKAVETPKTMSPAPTAPSLTIETIGDGARDFVVHENLGAPETDHGFGIAERWTAVRMASVAPPLASRKACLVVMNLRTVMEGVPADNSTSWEVIAIDPATRAFSRFEEAVDVPNLLHAAYGKISPDYDAQTGAPTPGLVTDLYYTEVTGPSAAATMKAALAQVPACGLSADISANNRHKDESGAWVGEPDGKVAFDPTPNRTWKLKNATFSLTRGSTVEIWDIRPAHLDTDFASYYSGGGGSVAPWGACDVRRWKTPSANAWNDVAWPVTW